MSSRSATLLNTIAALIGLVLVMWCFYPGYIDLDSLWQLREARSRLFEDAHPPLLAFLWGYFDRIVPGPFLMLLFQNIYFWSGLAIFVSLLVKNSIFSSLIILGMGLFPPIFLCLGTIWKDTPMAAALLTACSFLIIAKERKSRTAWVISLLNLYFAGSTRHDAIAAVFPMALWAGGVGYEICRPSSERGRPIQHFKWGVAVFLLIWIAGGLTNQLLVPKKSLVARLLPAGAQNFMAHDLVAISVKTNHVYLPAYMNRPDKPRTIEDLSRMYVPESAYPLFYDFSTLSSSGLRIPFSQDPKELSELGRIWMKTVLSHLPVYLHHRIECFKVLMGWAPGKRYNLYVYTTGEQLKLIGISVKPSRLNSWFMNRMGSWEKSLLFKSWIYALLIMLFMQIAVISRSELLLPILVVGSSALLRIILFFFVSSCAFFHYNLWTVCVALVLPVMLIRRLSHQKPSI